MSPDRADKDFVELSEIAGSIQRMFQRYFDGVYWVRAEMVKLNHYRKSGHCYPDLVEKKDGKVKAEMRATLWRSNLTRIQNKFREVVKKDLSDGMTILFKCRVRFHTIYGLSLDILWIDPMFTLGELAKEKRESIEKLKEEGVFTRNKELPFPLLPQRLAIISVDTSKGYHDLLKTLEGNDWGYKFFHMLFPAILQGDKAIGTIREQLSRIDRVRDHFDVVLIIRGGGGDVGLSCYDSHELARDIATFPLPVITGIGHSTNETVSEMVAYYNPITPTEVGYFLIQKFHNFSVKVDEAAEAISRKAKEMLRNEEREFLFTTERIQKSAKNLLAQNELLLDHSRQRIRQAVPGLIREQEGKVDELKSRFSRNTRDRLKHESKNLDHLEGQLRLMKPENVLKRGYSITSKNGKAIRSIEEVEEGDELKTRVYGGTFRSKVHSRKKDEQ